MKQFFIPFFSLFMGIVTTAQTGRVGINTSSPQALLHVKDSAVLFSGGINPADIPGNPPATGDGVRMMWYPDKAAFRVGYAVNNCWDKDSIGYFSFAYGADTRAIGTSSFSGGIGAIARGNSSIALGNNCVATGTASVSLGNSNKAENESASIGNSVWATGYRSTAIGSFSNSYSDYSMSLGYLNTVYGTNSIAIGKFCTTASNFSFAFGNGARTSAEATLSLGFGTVARAFQSVVLGTFNDSMAAVNPNFFSSSDPVFIVGNGMNDFQRNNAIVIQRNGQAGINTNTPQAMLHVVRGGISGGPFQVNAVAIFEGNSTSHIQLTTPNNADNGILSGNTSTAIRSGILFKADSSIQVRAGGSTLSRLTIENTGNIGINTITPNTKLHIINHGSSGGPTHSLATVILEDNTSNFIQFTNPDNIQTGILSGNTLTSIRSALLFGADSSVNIRAGGNFTRITVDNNGNVGVGTITPGALLDVNGTAMIGINGTALTEVIKVTVAKDVASVAANASVTESFAVTNAQLNSTVYISPASSLSDGLIIAYARVSAAGNVEVKFTNTTGVVVNPPAMNYFITVIR